MNIGDRVKYVALDDQLKYGIRGTVRAVDTNSIQVKFDKLIHSDGTEQLTYTLWWCGLGDIERLTDEEIPETTDGFVVYDEELPVDPTPPLTPLDVLRARMAHAAMETSQSLRQVGNSAPPPAPARNYNFDSEHNGWLTAAPADAPEDYPEDYEEEEASEQSSVENSGDNQF